MGFTHFAEHSPQATQSSPREQRLQKGLSWVGDRATAWRNACIAELPLATKVATLRQQAATLLNGVLEDTLTPRQAINRWPAPQGVDSSLDVAFLALAHLEADHYDHEKTQQFLDPYYLDAQLAWLQQLWEWLSQGESVPEAFWHEYKKTRLTTGWYTEPVVGFGPLWKGLHSIKATWKLWRRIVLQR
ncbi:MAG: hypothetical protein QE263_06130 [Vampirovibrionales bacterium]|nr:hypothetical protein [Vampirovibrionales bacterium]